MTLELAGEAEARIVDQGADRQPFRFDLRDQARRGAGLGKIGVEDMGGAAGFRGDRFEPVAAARDEDQILAARRALPCEFDSEPRRRTANQSDGAGQGPSPSATL